MNRRDGPPGRETAAAHSRMRRIWYGYGSLARDEKSRFGLFLNDLSRLYAEVSLFALPTLLFIMDYPAAGWFDAKATGILAWMTMTLVGTLIRIGWIRPLASETRGWVTLDPWLIVLRLGYFNLAVATATFGGLFVATVVGWSSAGLLWSGGVAAVSMLSFPALAEAWLTWVRRHTAL